MKGTGGLLRALPRARKREVVDVSMEGAMEGCRDGTDKAVVEVAGVSFTKYKA
jgi:hypothetical protein